jgi:Resolvase, N terminal domain
MGERLTEVAPAFRIRPTDLAPVPAAQYLRMSTEHQEHSLPNQTDIIGKYAVSHGLAIVRTDSDPATSECASSQA